MGAGRWLTESSSPTSSRCASSCPARRAARWGSRSGCCVPATGGRLRRGPDSRCPRRSRCCCSPTVRGRSAAPLGAGLLHGLKLVAVAIVAQAVWAWRARCAPTGRGHRLPCGRAAGAVRPAVGRPDRRNRAGWHRRVVAVPCASRRPQASASLVPVSRRARSARRCRASFCCCSDCRCSPPHVAGRRAVRRVLSLGRAGVRRRPRGVAAAARRGGDAGLGCRRHLPGRLRRRASRTGAAVHLRGLSGSGRRVAPARHRWRRAGAPRDLPAGDADPDRHVAVLGWLRRPAGAQAAMRGVNAAVVGLLGAALYEPGLDQLGLDAGRFRPGAGAFVLLVAWRAPPLVVVIRSAAEGPRCDSCSAGARLPTQRGRRPCVRGAARRLRPCAIIATSRAFLGPHVPTR